MLEHSSVFLHVLQAQYYLSDFMGTQTHNNLVCKQTPNHLAKLPK